MEATLLLMILLVVWYYAYSARSAAKQSSFQQAAYLLELEAVIRQSSTDTLSQLRKIEDSLTRLVTTIESLKTELIEFNTQRTRESTERQDILFSISGGLDDVRTELSTIERNVKAISLHSAFSQPDSDD